jgi:hypothetical protein
LRHGFKACNGQRCVSHLWMRVVQWDLFFYIYFFVFYNGKLLYAPRYIMVNIHRRVRIQNVHHPDKVSTESCRNSNGCRLANIGYYSMKEPLQLEYSGRTH